MSRKALQLLLEQVTEKEQKAAQEFAASQMQLQAYRQQLKQLYEYQRTYMTQLSIKALEGLDAAGFSHYQSFISRLETAAREQHAAIIQSEKQLEQKRLIWTRAQTKRKSFELLIDKQLEREEARLLRQEQLLQDEYSITQFVRRSRESS
ncbi:flagellar export protein FliJ [Dongshaea marina]|uniref:flagellar export protein FliJ n=1 Tax=Dongshaea marina TaxID=2047966 RepID=UPI000D3EB10E|nr:flagellar export protein FliJ [Dongshaea marina]